MQAAGRNPGNLFQIKHRITLRFTRATDNCIRHATDSSRQYVSASARLALPH
jgi:hypothetical protein